MPIAALLLLTCGVEPTLPALREVQQPASKPVDEPQAGSSDLDREPEPDHAPDAGARPEAPRTPEPDLTPDVDSAKARPPSGPASASRQLSGAGAGGGAGNLFLGFVVFGRGGEQFNDTWGVEAELSFGSSYFMNQLRGAVTFDVTPVDWFTFAVGPMARLNQISLCGESITATVVGALVRLDFHVDAERRDGRRSALTIGLVGDLGVASSNGFNTSGLAYGFYLMPGWAWY
jgi:hypothetical protein